MAIAVEALVQAAREFNTQAQPFPELGIDWWDVAEFCPFHGFYAWDKPCACEAARIEAAAADHDDRYDREVFHFDRVADREAVVRKENRW
jgi:PP-loop superfamily ATP-utilizing enzyme